MSKILENKFGTCVTINNADAGNSMCPKIFKNMLLAHIYSLLILALDVNTSIKMYISLRLVPYGFHVTYESVFFTTLVKI